MLKAVRMGDKPVGIARFITAHDKEILHPELCIAIKDRGDIVRADAVSGKIGDNIQAFFTDELADKMVGAVTG